MASHKEQKSVHTSAKHGSGSIFSTELRGGTDGVPPGAVIVTVPAASHYGYFGLT